MCFLLENIDNSKLTCYNLNKHIVLRTVINLNNKIFEKVLNIISVVTAIDILTDLLKDLSIFEIITRVVPLFNTNNANLSQINGVIKSLFIIIILIGVFFYKRSFVDLYSVLNQMSQNNKLHPVREKVMTTYKILTSGYNPFKIDQMNFTYTIRPSKLYISGNKKFDVQYDIDFIFTISKFSLFLANKRKKDFTFYVIADADNNLKLQRCFYKLATEPHETDFFPTIHDVTRLGSSGDRIKRFSGLEEFTLAYPLSISNNKETIHYHISYLCSENLQTRDKKYSFTIIPDNYSNKVKNIDIYIDDISNSLTDLELQEFDGGPSPKNAGVFSFSHLTDNGREFTKYHLTFGSIKPNMSSVYFVQFSYK